MAEESRETLVSYLWDVCSVELLCKSLEEEMDALEQEARHCQAALERQPLDAAKPEPVAYRPDAGVILFIGLGVLSLGALVLLSLNWVKKLVVLAMAVFWLRGAAEVWREEQRKLDQRFRKKADEYESACQYNAGLQQEVRRLEGKWEENAEKRERLRSQREAAQALRKDLYDRGWIPPDFRSCASACYLYLRAATSHETDPARLTGALRPGEVRSYMEDYLSPDWENMLTCRWEQALWEQDHDKPSEDPLHNALSSLLLEVEY